MGPGALATLLVGLCLAQEPEPVRAQIDLQGHPAMHLTWKFFSKGLSERTPHRRYKHQFRQIAHAPWIRDSGTRIHLMAAMAAEKARNPEQARRLILSELAYVEAFVARNSEEFALAKSPEEARRLVAETDKQVVIHSIEGGHLLLSGPEDAAFWAEQGVAVITLMHLRDDELGGAGILPMTVGPLVNRAGARHRRREERRGLTERGAAAIVELADAGILTDLSHMAPDTVVDALRVTGEAGIPPLVTHAKLRKIRNTELGWGDDQVLEVYRQGGLFALGLAGHHLDPLDPQVPVPEDLCEESIESWAFQYQSIQALVGPDQPIGWSSDWNGWVSHSAPVYGRCRSKRGRDDLLELDTRGLAHPGLLPQHWRVLEREGVDLEPIHRSAERFLSMWEQVRGRSVHVREGEEEVGDGG